MLWSIYVVGFVAQCSLCSEIDQLVLDVPEIVPYEEYQDDVSEVDNQLETILSDVSEGVGWIPAEVPIEDSPETNDEVLIQTEELTDDTNDDDETSPEDDVSFAGPVKAKGAVSVAATFGYDPSIMNYPAPSTIGNPFFPPMFPQYFFPPSLDFTSSIPPTMTNPKTPTIFINIDKLSESKENLSKIEIKPASKEIFLIATSLKNEETDDDSSIPVIDSRESDPGKTGDNDVNDGKDSAAGDVFSGFVPAKGSVKIAARF